MTRFHAAIHLLILLMAGSLFAVEPPPVTQLSALFRSGRWVEVKWKIPSVSEPPVHTDVYRDGDLVYTGLLGGSDEETGGKIWRVSGGVQYFNDRSARPGSTHEYTVVNRSAGGEVSPGKSTDVLVRLPALTVGTPFALAGRGIRNDISLENLAEYPDFRHTIYRDGILVNSITLHGLALDNGDTASKLYSSWTYTDMNTIPDEVHHYRMVTSLYEGGPELEQEYSARANPIPFGVLTPTYYYGSLRVSFVPSISLSYFSNARYSVYRDGVKLCEFPARSVGGDDQGNSWSGSGQNCLYTHENVTPGIYLYTFVAHPYPGYDISVNRTVEVAEPNIQLKAQRENGSTAYLRFIRNPYSFAVDFEIYRNNEKVATLASGETGSDGDRYEWGPEYPDRMFFRDRTLQPLEAGTYRVVVVFPDGTRSESYATADIHTPSITQESGLVVTDAYMPVLRQLPTGEYLVGATVRRSEVTDGTFTAYAAGGDYVFVDSGTASLELAPEDFPASGKRNLLILLPDYIDPHNTTVNLYMARPASEPPPPHQQQ